MVDRIAAVAAVVTVVVVAVAAAAETAAVALALIVALQRLKHVVLQQYQEPVAVAAQPPVVRLGPAVLPIHRFPLLRFHFHRHLLQLCPLRRLRGLSHDLLLPHPCFLFPFLLLLLERKTLVRKDRRRPD